MQVPGVPALLLEQYFWPYKLLSVSEQQFDRLSEGAASRLLLIVLSIASLIKIKAIYESESHHL